MINSKDPEQIVAFEYWYCEKCPDCLDVFRPVSIFRISQDIGNVDRSAFKHRTPGDAVTAGPNWILLYKLLERLRGVESHFHPQQLAIEAKYHRSVSPTQLDRAFGDGFKHRLKIERRAADNLK